MKKIEKDLARYMPSQLPAPNAPMILAEFWMPRMGDLGNSKPEEQKKVPKPQEKEKDKKDEGAPKQKPEVKPDQGINPYYDRDHGDNYGW